MLMVPIKSYLLARDVFAQLQNPFWKFLEDIEIVVVKAGSQTKREQQRLTKMNSMNIFKTKNVFTDGSLHQIQSRNLEIVFMLFNSCCFARVYREQ